jgi:hypothetical protein
MPMQQRVTGTTRAMPEHCRHHPPPPQRQDPGLYRGLLSRPARPSRKRSLPVLRRERRHQRPRVHPECAPRSLRTRHRDHTNSESRPHSTYSSQRSDERGRRPPGLFSISSNNATEPPKGREQPLVRAHMSDCWEPDPKTRAVEVDQRPVRLRTLADRPKRRHCLPQTLPAPRL